MTKQSILCKFKLLDKQITSNYDCDNGCVYFNSSYLDQLPFQVDDWINLKLVDDINHLAQISVYDKCKDDCVYISPIVYYNLLGSDKHTDYRHVVSSTCLTISPVKKPEITQEIHLSLVTSPDYPHLSDLFHLYESLITDYFSKQRIVKRNDVIAVASHNNPDYYRLNDDFLSIHWPVIYFSVQKIGESTDQSKCFLTSPEETKIYIFGIVHCSLPLAANHYLSDKPNLPIPDRYILQLTKLVAPYLKQLKRRIGTVLLSGPPGCGKHLTVRQIAANCNLNLFIIECHELLSDTTVATAKSLEGQLAKVKNYAPCIVLLRSIDLICLDKEDTRVEETIKNFLVTCQRDRNPDYGIILIASTSKPVKEIFSKFGSIFTNHNHITLEPLDEDERRQIIQVLVKDKLNKQNIIDKITRSTGGYYYGDLMSLMIKVNRADDSTNDPDSVICSIIKEMDRKYARSLGAPMVPNVKWTDIGGLEEAKKEVLDCIQRPTDYPQLKQRGLRRCGFLLYGPPGTGKTLLAKAVASQFSYNFLSIKGPELISAYVGQSEENIRATFQRAIKARPSIVFFDELDSLAPKRGKFGDSGGVMDRIVSQLACEMDLVANYSDIFVFGATNRPDLLDSALLRPGRFDRWVYVGPPSNRSERVSVLKALTHEFTLSKDLSLSQIEQCLPESLTGADFYSICSTAMMSALQRCVIEIENSEKEESLVDIVVTQQDFDHALKNFIPSVKKHELDNYKLIKSKMQRD